MLGSYAVAAVLCLLSAAVGHALYRVLRIPPAWSAPAVGLAVVIAVAPVAIELPGHGVTAAAALVVLGVASLPFLRGARVRGALEALPVALVVAAATAIPFAANWRFGPLGAGFNSDLGPMLAWADALRRGDEGVAIIVGYPLGAHATAGAFGALFGTDALIPFTALLIVTPVLSAVTALGALPDLTPSRRFLAAGVIALPFLVAAHYAQQAAFKELVLTLFVLAATVSLFEVRREGDGRLRRAVPAGVLAGGALSVYGAPAASYALALLGAWLVAELAAPKAVAPLRRIRGAAAFGAAAAAAAAVVVAPQLPRLLEWRTLRASTIEASEGNVPESVSRFAVLGLWPSVDFRFAPDDARVRWAIGIFVVAVVVYAAFWWLRRRDVLVPAVVVAAVGIHAVTEATQSAYVAAKTLAIAAPLTMLLCCRPLLADLDRRHRRPVEVVAVGLAATAFLAGAVWSSGLVLRHGAVGPMERSRDLAQLRPVVDDEPTLFLGQSYFAAWELQGARLSLPVVYTVPSQIEFALREGKPVGGGAALDFDTVEPTSLDAFRYVVTPRTAFTSTAPPNWRRGRVTRHYVLWVRGGPTPPREVLEEGQFPGATMNCDESPPTSSGVAHVWPEPVIGAREAWRTATGFPTLFDALGYAAVAPGDSLHHTLDLRPGRWEISLQYASPRPLKVEARGISVTLPPMLDPRGDFWRVATVISSGGALEISVTPQPAPVPLARVDRHIAVLGTLAARKLDEAAARVPVARACGRYVDAYAVRAN